MTEDKKPESKFSVLVVDDDPDKRMLLTVALQMAGYEVRTANDGEQALASIESALPDLVITDVMMPKMDGYELARALRANPKTRFIPIIMTTAARNDAQDLRRGSEVGALGYITDPTDIDLLLARARTLLDFKRYLDMAEGEAAKGRALQEKYGHLDVSARRGGGQGRDPYRLIGSVLSGKYELVEYAGSGGMGVVYRANHLVGGIVAVKILKPDIVAKNPDYAELFQQEVKSAEKLSHPHIVKLLDSGTDGEITFMVMEWLEGKLLEELLIEGSLPLERTVPIFKQICSAVAYAHEHRIIHLDLKPGNIFLVQDESLTDFVKVIDFGLSRIISRESGTTVTRFRGTHQYCAPEQFGGKVSHRSDIYILGATLYYLLSGLVPFGSSYINAKMHPNLELPDIPSLSKPPHLLPIAVDEVIQKALSRDPDKRQQSAMQLFEEFAEAIDPNRTPIKVSGIEGSVAALKKLYMTKGGYTHTQVDTAGITLFENFYKALLDQGIELKGSSDEFQVGGNKDMTNNSPPSKESLRAPFGGGRKMNVNLTTKAPISVQVDMFFVLEVPKNSDVDDEIVIRNVDTEETFEAKISELIPAFSSALQKRMRIAAKDIMVQAISKLIEKATIAMRDINL
jgi:serine/threonine protein kinase/CheY-like chemotaxis protein